MAPYGCRVDVEPGRDLGSTQSRVPASESSGGSIRPPSGLAPAPRPGAYTRWAKVWDALAVFIVVVFLGLLTEAVIERDWFRVATRMAVVLFLSAGLFTRYRARNAGRRQGV